MQLRLLASAMLVAVLTASLGSGAAAGDQWCEYDPVVVITTPQGAQVPVYVTNGAAGGPEYAPAVLAAQMVYTAEPGHNWGGQGTHVHLYVVVPSDGSGNSVATRSVASSGPAKSGVIYGKATGVSGQVMELMFNLPQS